MTAPARSRRFLAAALLVAATLASPQLARAQSALPMRMAIDVEPGTRTYCRSNGRDLTAYILLFPLVSPAMLHRCDAKDEDVSRRVLANLEPLIESRGYAVERVKDGRRAMREGKDGSDYHASLRVEVDAKPVYLVHDARRFEDEEVVDEEAGVAAWGTYTFWWLVDDHVHVTHGKVGPVRSQVRDTAGGVTLDDEESVSRLFADLVAGAVDESLRPAAVADMRPAPAPRVREGRERPAREPAAPRTNRDRWKRE